MSVRILLCVIVCLCFVAAPPARAQEASFVQIEALPTLARAQERARAYANALDNVNGFRLSSGWYAVALGPFSPGLARAELAALRRELLIPADSYIAEASDYGQQFWPVGGTALTPPLAVTPLPDADEAVAAPAPPVYVPDETPQEARRSERLLTSEERRDLQEAMQWFGFYTAAIDGAFGPGTRRAMADWQAAQGYDASGILTTAQRAELMQAYRAPFDALGLRMVRNDDAGIDMLMPMARVALARTDAPFVQYDSTNEGGMRVLLISQSGDEATLFGLYDIMQTLEIVPATGPRERQARQFTLRGESARLNSHTFARLENGAIKGFTLVWQDEDPRVIERVLDEMRASFTTLPGVLPDSARAGDVAEPRLDLLAGLEIRRPIRSRSGFFVDAEGAVLTSASAVQSCGRVTIGDDMEAQVAAEDPARDLALLRPATRLAPIRVVAFQSGQPRLRAEVAVAGFPYGDALSLPVMTYGTVADLRGLGGEEELARLDLGALPGDAGGPVLDTSGAVMGMLRAAPEDGARRLPEGVSFAVDVAAIAEFLGAAGLSPRAADATAPLPPEDLAALGADLAVRVDCWE